MKNKQEGFNAVYAAVKFNARSDLLKLLLDRGGDPNASDKVSSKYIVRNPFGVVLTHKNIEWHHGCSLCSSRKCRPRNHEVALES